MVNEVTHDVADPLSPSFRILPRTAVASMTRIDAENSFARAAAMTSSIFGGGRTQPPVLHFEQPGQVKGFLASAMRTIFMALLIWRRNASGLGPIGNSRLVLQAVDI